MPAPAPTDPDAPLRIAYLTYRGKPHVGGQGVYTRHLTKALVDLGHHVEVFSGQPYPVLDERVPLTKLPSLDVFNDHYPGRFPAYWEIKTREDLLELAQFSTGTFPEPLAFSYRALRAPAGRGPASSTSSTTTSASATGSSQLEKHIPTIVTLHHPITKDRQLEMDHAPNRRKRWSVGRWYSFVKMQGRVASRHAAHRRRQRELDPRHPHRHGRQLRPHAPRARRRRPRAVPPPPGGRPDPRAG